MAVNEDSRPFVELRHGSEDFISTFDDDIKKCLGLLNSKITSLLCDPDSIPTSCGAAKRLNAHMEFSKAKYEIFMQMKSLMDEKEDRWLQKISAMKGTFLENVEIFLASTKLDIKAPVSEKLSRSGNKSSSAATGLKARQSSPVKPASSLYPSLFNTAKHIPVLNSLLPNVQDDDEEESVTINTLNQTPRISRKSNRVSPDKQPVLLPVDESSQEEEEMDTDDEEELPQVQPVFRKNARVSRKTAAMGRSQVSNQIASKFQEDEMDDEAIVNTSTRTGRGARKSIAKKPSSLKKVQATTPLQRRKVPNIEKETSDLSTSDEIEIPDVPVANARRGGRSQILNESVAKFTPAKQTRAGSRRGGKSISHSGIAIETEMERNGNNYNDEEIRTPSVQNTSRNVHFSVGLDVEEDLELYSPDINISRSAPRRKTVLLNKDMDELEAMNLTPSAVRSIPKRKTIAANFADLSVAPSPKRLKRGSRSSMAVSTLALEENMDSNLLESDEAPNKGNYTPWVPLSDIGGKVPAQPGIYELKVSQAKKPAYIGSCDSLRQKITLHKLKQNSGHKHLDKFVERNVINILVRYEKMSSTAEAQAEAKSRINSFVSLYNTTPAYN